MAAYAARQSSYTDGDTINAAHTNDEFDAILAAFHVSTGHTHDGTTAGNGSPISKLYSNVLTFGTNADTDIAITFNANSNDGVLTWMEDEDYFQFSDDILLSTTEKLQFRDTAVYINSSADGQLDLVADTEIQIAATTVDINGAVDISGNLGVGGNLTVTGTTTFNGGTLTLGDADTDNIVFGGEVDSDIIPDDDGAFDLGSSSKEWKDLFIDGTANIDSLVADTADINGGTIDGAVIGGASAAAITGTAITGTSFVIGSADISEAELETIDGITAGTVAASKAVVVDSNKDATGFRNITITGELDAATLDVSGDVDIDGTLEADAITVNGVTLAETISDTVGAMVTSNTESGIAVAYDDADNTLDFTVGTLNQDTTGSAATLTTPRAIAVAGDVTGTANFDGSAGISITTTLATDAIVTANITNANVTLAKMAANSVDSDQYVDGSIDLIHMSANSVDSDQYVDGSIDLIHMSVNSIDSDQYVDGSIDTAHLADDAITSAKLDTNLDIAGTLDVTGVLTADSNATIAGTLGVTGVTTVGGLTIGSAVITEAELETIDGITNGTVIASKAIITDANIDITGGRNITISGELDAATLDISGNADIDGTLEADAITIGGTAIGSIYSGVAGSSSIVTTGALNSGSITSGFGAINNGSSAITTTGTVTFGSISDGTITATAFVDEDDMSSDSATLIPTQQSVKAYVDGVGAATPGFAVAMAIAL